MSVTISSERLARLEEAKKLFESDTGRKTSIEDFIDMLVKTYVAYRDKRGASESSLIKKLTESGATFSNRERENQ